VHGPQTRQGTNFGPILLHNAKIQEQEGLPRTKVNCGQREMYNPFTSILCYKSITYIFAKII